MSVTVITAAMMLLTLSQYPALCARRVDGEIFEIVGPVADGKVWFGLCVTAVPVQRPLLEKRRPKRAL